jgi:outer membrane immunogenic protein
MKRILIAAALAFAAGGQALAADLPPPVAPRAPATYVPVPAPVFSWTGFYLGVNGGYAFGPSDWSSPLPIGSTGNFNTTGFLIGGTVGGNYQIGQFVIGVEGDGDWSNLNGTTNSVAGTCNFAGCETRSDWLATVRGRAGYAWDRVLFYGTGGAAFGNLQAAAGTLPFSSTTQTGWTAGAGVEAAFAPNWTAKVEYLYVDLGSQSCGVASCGAFGGTSVSLKENLVRAGINYKFGW